MHPRAKVPITDPPKVWVSGFLSVDGNGKLVLGIMKNQKNGSNSPKMHPRTYVQIANPPKVRVSGLFQVLTEMENWCWELCKIRKMALTGPKMCPRAKAPITDLLKFGYPVFRSA